MDPHGGGGDDSVDFIQLCLADDSDNDLTEERRIEFWNAVTDWVDEVVIAFFLDDRSLEKRPLELIHVVGVLVAE